MHTSCQDTQKVLCTLLMTLTHWCRVTHICVNKLIIIGLHNGLSSGRHQAIIWINARILLIGLLGTNINDILIEIHIFSLKNPSEDVVRKMVAILYRHQCVNCVHSKVCVLKMMGELKTWIILIRSMKMPYFVSVQKTPAWCRKQFLQMKMRIPQRCHLMIYTLFWDEKTN